MITTHTPCQNVHYQRIYPDVNVKYYVIAYTEKTRRQLKMWNINKELKKINGEYDEDCSCENCRSDNF